MNINPNFNRHNKKPGNVAKATAVILGIGNDQVEVQSTEVSAMCAKFAEIAESMGKTNNAEQYAAEMEESILKSYKKVSRKQKDKKRRQ